MMIENYPQPDCNDFPPDAYDSQGKLTINSWELFKLDELSQEDDN